MNDFVLKEIDKLRKEIERHNHLYFVLNSPEISDGEYDFLVKKLEELEDRLGIDSENSPTTNVSSDISGKFKKIKHKKPMLSLSNSYTLEDLDKFNERMEKALGEEVEYLAGAKIDGFSVSLIYDDFVLKRALTRGNGKVGEDITKNALQISSIPKKIGIKKAEIRGEIIMPKKVFNKLNVKRLEDNLSLFANPRNAAAGSVRQLNHEVVKDRELDSLTYHLIGSDDQYESIKYMDKLGFKTIEHYKKCANMEKVKEFIEEFREIRKSLDYETDGVVVSINESKYRDVLGYTNKSPRWAIAYKYPAMQTVTKIEGVTFQMGRTGVITPVAELRPVRLEGSLISRATLHNFEDLEKKDIKIGDEVFIEKGGDVIPKVIKAIKEKRSGKEINIVRPDSCPFCEKELIIDGAAMRCINNSCKEILKKRIEFFVSREAMDISGLGPKIIEKLIEYNIVNYPEDLYLLNKEQILEMDGFKELSANNLLESIDNSKNQSYDRVLFSLGIRHVGKHAAQILSKYSVSDLEIIGKDTLEDIEGIGSKTAESIQNFFNNPESLKRIEFLKGIGLNLEPKKTINSEVSGKKFLITGTLNSFKREELKRMLGEKGATFALSPSKSLDYLILGNNPGSKLKKVEKLIASGEKIEILKEEELKEKMKKW